MTPTPRPQREDELFDDERPGEDRPRAPEEEHDVPDDKVIEKTLPSAPMREKEPR